MKTSIHSAHIILHLLFIITLPYSLATLSLKVSNSTLYYNRINKQTKKQKRRLC